MFRTLLPFFAAMWLAAACGDGGEGAAPEAGSVSSSFAHEPAVVEHGEPGGLEAGFLAQPRFAQADLARGELLSLSCVVCHTLGPGDGHLDGPNLHGVFGRSAASAADFDYSPALRAADVVWTPDVLDAWLADPDGFVPGNIMVFAGLNSASDRAALLAYLLRETGSE